MTASTRGVKNIMAAFLFLVTWQEYELKDNCDPGRSIISLLTNPPRTIDPCDPKIYTVETVDKSIRLKTQKDVDLFVTGTTYKHFDPYCEFGKCHFVGGLIPTSAFNVTFKEIKE